MGAKSSIRVGGWALIVGAVAFIGVFSYLAAKFDYPAILDGPASTVLPHLLATGSTGRAVWAIYAFLPLFWIPAGVGTYRALRRWYPGSMLMALQLTLLASLGMMLGLMRWPTIHWRLAELYSQADPAQQVVLAAVFDGFNVYLGNYLGEFLGELCVNVFFLIAAWAMLKSRIAPRPVALLGLVTGAVGLVAMFRNVAPAVLPVSAIDNYLLPFWMILLGVFLLRVPIDPVTGEGALPR